MGTVVNTIDETIEWYKDLIEHRRMLLNTTVTSIIDSLTLLSLIKHDRKILKTLLLRKETNKK